MIRTQDLGVMRIVAKRELSETFRRRSFLIGTVVQAVVLAGIILAIGIFGDSGPEEYKVGTVGGASAGIVMQLPGESMTVVGTEYDSPADARAALNEGEVDAVIVGGKRILTDNSTDDELVAVIQATAARAEMISQLEDQGLNRREIETVLSPEPLAVVATEKDDEGAATVALLGSVLLYVVLISFGYTISTSVVEEKSSRVIEVLLAAIRPSQLLVGKIFGIGIVGILQLMFTLGIGVLVAMLATDLTLPSTTGATLVAIAVFFVLGYAFYSFAFATAGALVSRQEDASNTTSPLLAVLVGGYVASTFAIAEPDGTLAAIMTYVPPLAPLIIPVRVATESISAAELVLATALMLAGIALMATVAIRIYRRTVLRMGPPVKLGEALSSLRR